jgi:hypothetical protein
MTCPAGAEPGGVSSALVTVRRVTSARMHARKMYDVPVVPRPSPPYLWLFWDSSSPIDAPSGRVRM